MGITGSIIVYVMIWWIIFFQFYQLEFSQIKKFLRKKLEEWILELPKNPKIGKKFLITTLITTIIFSVIYYLVNIDLLNLREFLQ